MTGVGESKELVASLGRPYTVFEGAYDGEV